MGEWSELVPWPDNGTHFLMLPSGKILSWNRRDEVMNLWDPVTGARSRAALPGYEILCAGHALLSDGRVFVSGGHIDTNKGLPNASIYDPQSDSWTRLPDMNAGRWYPTNLPLPNGDMLVIAGTDTARRVGENRMPQIWQKESQSWRDLTDAQLAMRTYPWMFVAPNGLVFNAGPDPIARYLDPSGTGKWIDVAPSLYGDRFTGSAVMYADGKILVCGGGDFPTETAEVIDLNAPAPQFRSVQSMRQPRKQHNTTLLPDGTVLVTGGSGGPGQNDTKSPVFTTELWDPVSETFSVLAPTSVYRGYHSSALLLPDGRVIFGGGDSDDFEIFSPPYLFRGPRPTITGAPEGIAWGQPFQIHTPDAAKIAKVTLLKLGSSTHAFNVGQRIHDLTFTRGPGVLTVTPPKNAVEAQPGHFMLFLLDETGVPSVAPILQLGETASHPPIEEPVDEPPVGGDPNAGGPGIIDGDGDLEGDNVGGGLVAPDEQEKGSKATSCASSGSLPATLPLLIGAAWMLKGWRRSRRECTVPCSHREGPCRRGYGPQPEQSRECLEGQLRSRKTGAGARLADRRPAGSRPASEIACAAWSTFCQGTDCPRA